MSICRKCGGKLQGDNCPRHGSQHKAPTGYRLAAAPPAPAASEPHNPFSPETDRRVFAMVGTLCKGCQISCGDLERCPMLRARWFGDSPAAESRPQEPETAEVLPPPLLAPKSGFQMSLF